ncbi:MAG: class I SAM-dependent methyltransferase [Sulfurimicrobium sp.]|nr:class I SAM-dependent methyltransferase [Sulfurimicrobium sp.]
MSICKICQNERGNASYLAREMMFNFRDEFEYIKCAHCGCLHLAEIPENLSKYYPDAYYSYQEPPRKEYSALLLRLRKIRSRSFLGQRSFVGGLLASLSTRQEHFDWLKRAGVNFDSEILDVGCGAGGLLLKLQREGFHRLSGVDPFIADDIAYENGVRVFKKELGELDRTFDFIMLNHSLEHMPDQLTTMKKLHELIHPDGCVLIRIPVVDCYAWRKYGIDWVALDAPRHIYLHTVKSMHILAEQSGFEVTEVVYDSTVHQFQNSEHYLRGIPYKDHKNEFRKPGNRLFSDEEKRKFEKFAELLNTLRDGDTACFYLRKSSGGV